MASVTKYCARCQWRTVHVNGVCRDCATPTPPEPPTPGGTIDMFAGWQSCPTCPPDDNEWGPDAFTQDPKGERCDACFSRRRARLKCSRKGCGRTVETFADIDRPLCRPCRRRLHPLRLAGLRAPASNRKDRPCRGCGRRVNSTATAAVAMCKQCRHALGVPHDNRPVSATDAADYMRGAPALHASTPSTLPIRRAA